MLCYSNMGMCSSGLWTSEHALEGCSFVQVCLEAAAGLQLLQKRCSRCELAVSHLQGKMWTDCLDAELCIHHYMKHTFKL